MHNNLMGRYIFIDTETGGIDTSKHPLLSIGLVVWDVKKGILDRAEFFIKHESYVVTKEAQSINKFDEKIHNEVAKDGKIVIKEMTDFICKNFPSKSLVSLAGHNIQFDTNFLKQFLINNGRSYNSLFSHRMIDTNSIVKALILAGKVPENVSNLTDALKFFGVKIGNRHSALEDSIATVCLFEKMIDMIKG